jgi:hypothetical protein
LRGFIVRGAGDRALMNFIVRGVGGGALMGFIVVGGVWEGVR